MVESGAEDAEAIGRQKIGHSRMARQTVQGCGCKYDGGCHGDPSDATARLHDGLDTERARGAFFGWAGVAQH